MSLDLYTEYSYLVKHFMTINDIVDKQIQESLFAFARRSPFDGDLDGYIESYSKNQADPSEYTLNLLYGTGDHFGLWLDAPYSFYLKRKWSPIACISFDVEEDIAIVKQIQGVRGVEEALKPLRRWERMLLRITADWASRHGFRQVRVQRAEDSKYYGNNPKYQEKFVLRHNVTARREGFQFDEKSGYYVLGLTMQHP